MGSIGSDISIEASNITLIHDNISDCPIYLNYQERL